MGHCFAWCAFANVPGRNCVARCHLKFGRELFLLACVGFLLCCSFGKLGRKVEGFKIDTPRLKHLIYLKYHY